MIRVLLVDDSPVALLTLKRLLAISPDIEMAGTAKDGVEALRMIPDLKPDVICLDLPMPRMDGLELTHEIMARHPLPILVISIAVDEGSEMAFQLLAAGAIDIFNKPRMGLNSAGEPDPMIARSLADKIRLLSGVVPIRRHKNRRHKGEPRRLAELDNAAENRTLGRNATPLLLRSNAGSEQRRTGETLLPKAAKRSSTRDPKLVMIGASTGGPQVLQSIFSSLPAHFPLPIICIQHISDGFLENMVVWLDSLAALPVQVAQSGEKPRGGVIYFPPEQRQLELDAEGRFFLYEDTMCSRNACPSVDATFLSAVHYYRDRALAILLTGMGRDEAEGMKALHASGSITIAQDESSCVVFGMPWQAIQLGVVQHVLSPSRIIEYLKALA